MSKAKPDILYIAILRGINVSGKNKLAMAELKSMFVEMGFKKVETYIQSGNVVFASKNNDTASLQNKIELKIREKFNLEVPVIIRTKEEFQVIYGINPFLQSEAYNQEFLQITFLKDIPDKDLQEKIKTMDFQPDEFRIIDREIFVYCPHGYGRTKINNNFFENKLKVTATTRSRRTVGELLKIADTF